MNDRSLRTKPMSVKSAERASSMGKNCRITMSYQERMGEVTLFATANWYTSTVTNRFTVNELWNVKYVICLSRVR